MGVAVHSSEDNGLDTDFYRSYYTDLAKFTDSELVKHYKEYGRGEGRFSSMESLRTSLDIPFDFDVADYLLLNPDVLANCSNDMDVYVHFSRYGSAEGRPYTLLDKKFYWELYLSDYDFDPKQTVVHFSTHRHRDGVFPSLRDMLLHYDITDGIWLDLFSARDFSIYNFDWVGRMLNRSQAIEIFLREGISRIAKFSAKVDFDVDFYRDLHGAEISDKELYAYWLCRGLQHGEKATQTAWLSMQGLHCADYPASFLWRTYTREHMPREGLRRSIGRWEALAHFLNNSEIAVRDWPIRRQGGSDLLERMGQVRHGNGLYDIALEAYRRARLTGSVSANLPCKVADVLHAKGDWKAAAREYDAYHAAGGRTIWSVCLGADAHGRIGEFDEAFETLSLGRESYAGESRWREQLDITIEAFFAHRSGQARTLYRTGARNEADALMTSAAGRVEELWRSLTDLPVPLPDTGTGPVVILANTGLRQCTHYRVEQKADLFETMSVDHHIFDMSQTDEFIAALAGASAAIFYRLPATPGYIRAIAMARAWGIPTYYEIDDLIFASDAYPDSFASFEGQIDREAYVGLMYGVPLFRAAMAMCDYGIASTTALADEMNAVVRSGRSFVVRNGLDHRNLSLGDASRTAHRNDGKIRIVYGSATLAHNEDFNLLLSGPLCDLMRSNPAVELVIVGHLVLGGAFDPFRGRITRIPLLSDARAFWSVLAGCDINLAVLVPGRVSDCKSEIKWLEAAVLGIPSIVSTTATYRDVIDDGEDGLICETRQDWSITLRRLVGDPALRSRIGAKARESALARYVPAINARSLSDALQAGRDDRPKSARKPRILVVNVFFPPQTIGGATRVVAGNVDDWIREGLVDEIDLGIVAVDHGATPAYAERYDSYRGIPVFRIAPLMRPNMDWQPYDPKMAAWFTRIVGLFSPDVIHFHCVQRLTASIVEVVRAAAIPYIVSVHDGWWVSDHQFLFDGDGVHRTPGDEPVMGSIDGVLPSQSISRQIVLRDLLNAARHVLAPSESFAALYRAAGVWKCRSIANGLPDFRIKPRRPSASGRVRLGHIGNTTAHKGFNLVEAALRQNRFDSLELLAIDHSLDENQEIHTIWGATPVRIRGPVPQSRIADLYAELDVLLAPSAWSESFGLVTREANAAGLWVIAGNRGAIGDDVREGKDGYVVDVSRPTALARVLAEMDARPGKYLKPIVPRQVRSARNQANDVLKLYREILYSR